VSKRKTARFMVRFVFLGTAAGALAGYSAHAMRPAKDPVPTDAAGIAAPRTSQVSNRIAKADRLPVLTQAELTSADSVTYSLASLTTPVDNDPVANDMLTAPPALAYAAPERADPPADAHATTELPAIAAAPLPRQKPKHRAPPPESTLLDDTHIAGIKRQLQLTPDQVGYWPAVEAALREIGKTQFRDKHIKLARAGKVKIDANAPEVQKLIWAAMPLLGMLREDQKNEVRKLARVIGLDDVASQI
jgi:hypothetical protein